jgi:hypothetical protein
MSGGGIYLGRIGFGRDRARSAGGTYSFQIKGWVFHVATYDFLNIGASVNSQERYVNRKIHIKQ